MGKSKKRSRPAEDDEAEAMAAPPRAKKARTAEAAAAAASTSAVAESPRPAKKKRKSKKTEKEDEDGVELEDDGQREKGGGKVTTVKVHGRPRVHVQADAAEAKPALVPAKEYYDVEKEEKKRKKRERRENKAGRKAAGVDAGADAEGPKPTVKSDAVEAAAAKAAKSARKKKTKKDGKDGDKDGDDENDDDGNDEAKKPPRFIVFVGNLPFTATRESVAAHFAALHPASVRLLTEKADAAKSRGMAFVEFARFDHMQTALAKFHHSDFDDGRSAPRKINVELTCVFLVFCLFFPLPPLLPPTGAFLPWETCC